MADRVRRVEHPRLLISLALIALVFAVYAPVSHFRFLNFDDDNYVSANPAIQSGFSGPSIHWAFTTSHAGHWHPLTWLSHMLDWRLFGNNPSGHHLASVAWHASNVVLLFLLLSWLTTSLFRSTFVAAIFAVHPLNLASVAWIAERKTLISTFFLLLAFGAYACYTRRPRATSYLAVVAAFACALMAKPTAVVFPALLLLFDWWPLRRIESLRSKSQIARLILEKVPLGLLTIADALITYLAQKGSGAVSTLPALQHMAYVVWSYVAYLGKLLWPAHEAIFYPWYEPHFPAWQIALDLLLLVAITASCFRQQLRRYLATAWLFYLISMFPTSGVVPVGHTILADQHLYLPGIGVFILVVWAVADVANAISLPKSLRTAVAAVIIAALAIVTRADLPYWRNSRAAFAHAEELAPRPDYLIENNLAEGLDEEGRLPEATRHYEQAVALRPDLSLPHYNLANNLLAQGRAQDAIAEYRDALAAPDAAPSAARYLHNLGVAYEQAGNYDEAERQFTAALRLAPLNPATLLARGETRLHLQRYDEAATDLAQSAALQPTPPAFFLLGKALAGQGHPDLAANAYRKALALAPQFTAAELELDRLQDTASGPK